MIARQAQIAAKTKTTVGVYQTDLVGLDQARTAIPKGEEA
jgi:hypothetical protein